jgi:hypothetical protein
VFYIVNKRLEEERKRTMEKKDAFDNILKQGGLDERKQNETKIRLRKSEHALKEIGTYESLCGK